MTSRIPPAVLLPDQFPGAVPGGPARQVRRAPLPGQEVPVTRDGGPETIIQVFTAAIACEHHAHYPEPRIPLAEIQIIDNRWIHGLDPDGLSAVAAKLRAQADRLDHEVHPALVAARADWAAHHPDPYPNRLTPEIGQQPPGPPLRTANSHRARKGTR